MGQLYKSDSEQKYQFDLSQHHPVYVPNYKNLLKVLVKQHIMFVFTLTVTLK